MLISEQTADLLKKKMAAIRRTNGTRYTRELEAARTRCKLVITDASL
jgi:hypothetical protein